MANQSENIEERLSSDISLLRLVESAGVDLVREGKVWIGNCPFHEDSSQSLLVDPITNHWQCDGQCQTGGSVIEWVMKIEGISHPHAVELLRNDMPLTKQASDSPTVRSSVRKLDAPFVPSDDDRKILEQVVTFYHQTLKQSPDALAYLKKRRIDHPDAIDQFRLGFCNRSLGYRLPERNRKEGAAMRGRLQRLGILKGSGHEVFRGSLVVPITNNGEIHQVYGRKTGDRLRPGTPLHTFLPGEKRGIFNLGAAQISDELILCQSVIDALTFWCAGYRNVTCIYGLNNSADELLTALEQYAVKRVLIAYGATQAGNAAALSLADRLTSLGIDAYRIEFPREMDANDCAVQSKSPSKSLGDMIRKSTWLGKGKSPLDREVEIELQDQEDFEAADNEPVSLSSVPGSEAAQSIPTMPETQVVVNDVVVSTSEIEDVNERPIPASVIPPLPDEIEVEARDNEIVICLGDRRYRIRGLEKNLCYDQLKVNILLAIDERLHVDTFDLYASKPRAAFIKLAAIELAVSEEVLKKDLAKILLKLEVLQDQAIQQAITPKLEEVSLNDKEQQEAMSLLQSSNLVQRILDDYQKCGVVGEKTNKLVGYLATLSRKLDKPLAVMVQSSSAAGKSALMDAVLSFIPEEERIQYSAMTGQSLFYMGDINLSHKILAISEEEGASKASYALKLLQSEGQLTIASTGKDPNTGRHVTHEYRVKGPVMIFSTTTAIDIDEELLNRCLVLSVNEDRTQTHAIHAWQRYEETLEGMLASQSRDEIIRVHQNAQRLIKPLKVVNPYAPKLTFLDDKTRTRRDHTKYLALIRSIALLHQHQREIKSTYCGGKPLFYVEVTLDDIELANQVVHEILGRSLDDMPPQTWRLLRLISEMVAGHCDELQVSRSDYLFTRRDVRHYTGWGDTQLKVHLQRLEVMEYLLIHRGGRGKQIVYELLYNSEGQDGSSFLMGLIDVEALRQHECEAKRSGVTNDLSVSDQAQVGGVVSVSQRQDEPVISSDSKQFGAFSTSHPAGTHQELKDALDRNVAMHSKKNYQEGGYEQSSH